MHPIMAEQYMRLATKGHLQDAERWRRARTVRRSGKAPATGWRAAIRRTLHGLGIAHQAPAQVRATSQTRVQADSRARRSPRPGPVPANPALPPAPRQSPETERVQRQLFLTSGRH